MLPKEKITQEIATIRGIPMGVDCQSPNRFEEFDDAPSLLDFVERVRCLTGKPVGLKMVVGTLSEVDELCREIRKRGDGPDFIAVDGNEGGSGAAPVRNYALAIERDLQMITHACGLTHPSQLHGGHVVMNISPGVRKSLDSLFPYPPSQFNSTTSTLRSVRQSSGAHGRALHIETLVSK